GAAPVRGEGGRVAPPPRAHRAPPGDHVGVVALSRGTAANVPSTGHSPMGRGTAGSPEMSHHLSPHPRMSGQCKRSSRALRYLLLMAPTVIAAPPLGPSKPHPLAVGNVPHLLKLTAAAVPRRAKPPGPAAPPAFGL